MIQGLGELRRMLAASAISCPDLCGQCAAATTSAAQIARIVVNPDTFSAEYPDGGNTHRHITKAPDRRFRSILAPTPPEREAAHSRRDLKPCFSLRQPLGRRAALSAGFFRRQRFCRKHRSGGRTAVLTAPVRSDPAETGPQHAAISLSPDLYYYPSKRCDCICPTRSRVPADEIWG